MESQIDQAVATADYAALSQIFSGPWQSLGQGEQRTLAAYFVKSSLNSPTFLPKAFSSPEIIEVMTKTLGHLPQSVEAAADNTLRTKMFAYLTEEEQDFSTAAIILSGMRMEEHNESSPYYTTHADRTDTYVKIAECFLHEEEFGEAEKYVTKAGTSVESIKNALQEHFALILRFKSAYARVLDANRKFLQAASKYYDLSQVQSNLVNDDDLLEFLGRAATCAILAPSGSQRQRILGLVFKDERVTQLETISNFNTHHAIIKRMYMNQIIPLDYADFITFQEHLAIHQKAIMADGFTFVQRALMEHNMVAVSRLYKSIYFSHLGKLLGVSTIKAEKIASNMILGGNLVGGSIDQVDGVLNFQSEDDESGGVGEVLNWDSSITSFCMQLNRVTDAVRQIA
mmetsp:Transcript_16063/g.18630  ORF Transcript_16063/g.18630 Transcript_16063/m.18630 type:complete len:399 (-) Transcript_16063:120-1316(-)